MLVPHPPPPRVAPPLDLHVTLDTTDLDEAQAVAAAAQHPLSITVGQGRHSPARFRLHHHPFSCIAVTHAALNLDGELKVSAPPLETHYYLQIPLRGVSRVTHGALSFTSTQAGRALLLSPGHATTQRCTGGFEEITLEIDAEALARAWTLLTGEEPSRPVVFDSEMRLDVEPGASVLRLARFLVDEASRPCSALTSGLAAERLEEALILALLQGQPHSHARHLEKLPSRHRALLVREAEAWMEAHAAESISSSSVAEALGVSLRTLQRSFERHQSVAPREFLRRLRLERARRILDTGRRRMTVTWAAMAAGFTHLGRFSGDYRDRYGEAPSETLQRARKAAGGSVGSGSHPIGASERPMFQVPRGVSPGTCGFCGSEVPLRSSEHSKRRVPHGTGE